MMMDHTRVRLGKLAPKHDPRTLKLSKYATRLPPPPPRISWGDGVHLWPMFRNDQLGDCTIAAAGHMVEAWTTESRHREAVVTERDVLHAYEAVSGYNPITGENDNGAVELDVLKYWRSHGIAGRKITAFASVNHSNVSEVKTATWLFGGLYLGVELPVTAQTQDIWDVVRGGLDSAPGSWGGHAVDVVSYDLEYVTVITWGAPLKMTWAFFLTYVSEAYAVLSPDWLRQNKSPSGFNLAALLLDLAALT